MLSPCFSRSACVNQCVMRTHTHAGKCAAPKTSTNICISLHTCVPHARTLKVREMFCCSLNYSQILLGTSRAHTEVAPIPVAPSASALSQRS